MQEIIEINQSKLDGNLPILALNKSMEAIEKAAIQELEKNEYNSIVTMENFKVMKQSSLFLGKVAKQISDFRITKVKEESQDIKLFEDSLKKITKMFIEKQDTIKAGLDVFEEETRKKIKAECIAYFNQYAYEKQVREEFLNNVNLNDMTLSKYATASLKISKAGIEEVEKRVNAQLTLQTKVDNRLLSLENECLKAKIEPLTKEHIQGFLYADDAEYEIKLRNLIVSEISRNEAIKQRAEAEAKQREAELIAKAEKEKQEAITQAKEEVRQENISTPFDEPKPVVKENLTAETPKPTLTDDGKRIYKINFGFEIKALDGVDENKIIEKVKSMFLSEAGIQNLKNVEVA